MRWLLSSLLLLGFLLSGCASELTAADSALGWRSTGLSFPNAKKTGGVHKVIAVGNTLFAMDAFTPDSAPASRLNQWRLWKGRVGSLQWEQLTLPEGDIPQSWATDGSDLFVGTKYSGRLWSYSLGTMTWTKLALPLMPSVNDSQPYVHSIAVGDGQLFAGIGMNATSGSYCVSGEISGSLHQVPCVGVNRNITLDKLRFLDGNLYGIQYQFGVFRFNVNAGTWDTLPSAWGPQGVKKDMEMVSALGVHNGKIHVGFDGWWQGIFRWDDDHWTSLCPTSTDGKERVESAQTNYAIESFKGRLITAGSMGAAPTMQLSSETLKFGNWRIIDENWTNALGESPPDTRDLLGVGDTLYAAGWYGLVKVPFDQLDKIARPMFKD